MQDHVVVCDCHHVPMRYEAMVLLPSGRTIRCWVSDCGRYYSRLLGYFYLHGLIGTGNGLDRETRFTKVCTGEICSRRRFMGLVRDPVTAGQADAYWYCFKCGQVEWEAMTRTIRDLSGATAARFLRWPYSSSPSLS